MVQLALKLILCIYLYNHNHKKEILVLQHEPGITLFSYLLLLCSLISRMRAQLWFNLFNFSESPWIRFAFRRFIFFEITIAQCGCFLTCTNNIFFMITNADTRYFIAILHKKALEASLKQWQTVLACYHLAKIIPVLCDHNLGLLLDVIFYCSGN